MGDFHLPKQYFNIYLNFYCVMFATLPLLLDPVCAHAQQHKKPMTATYHYFHYQFIWDYFDLSLEICHHHNFPESKTDIQIASFAKLTVQNLI